MIQGFVILIVFVAAYFWLRQTNLRLKYLEKHLERISAEVLGLSQYNRERIDPVPLQRVYHVLIKIDQAFWEKTLNATPDELLYLKEQGNWDNSPWGNGNPCLEIQQWAGGYLRAKWCHDGACTKETLEYNPTNEQFHIWHRFAWAFKKMDEWEAGEELSYIYLDLTTSMAITLHGNGRFARPSPYLSIQLGDDALIEKYRFSAPSCVFEDDELYGEMDVLDLRYSKDDAFIGTVFLNPDEPFVRRYKGTTDCGVSWSVHIEDLQKFAEMNRKP